MKHLQTNTLTASSLCFAVIVLLRWSESQYLRRFSFAIGEERGEREEEQTRQEFAATNKNNLSCFRLWFKLTIINHTATTKLPSLFQDSSLLTPKLSSSLSPFLPSPTLSRSSPSLQTSTAELA